MSNRRGKIRLRSPIWVAERCHKVFGLLVALILAVEIVALVVLIYQLVTGRRAV